MGDAAHMPPYLVTVLGGNGRLESVYVVGRSGIPLRYGFIKFFRLFLFIVQLVFRNYVCRIM
jgi:hypothetical protein